MQRHRRHTPYPTTWEIPTALAVFALLALLAGVHVGRGTATLLAGYGWTWPAYLDLGRSLPAVLAGDPAAGLPAGRLPDQATAPVRACVIVVEAVLLLAAAFGVRYGWTRWGPGRMLGTATRRQAGRVLGERRLRKARRNIRPDLTANTSRPASGSQPLPAAAVGRTVRRWDPRDVGWRIGQAQRPAAIDLWCPWDRTCGVIGPQGSGKTLDLLTPALLNAPGPALVTLTKPADLLLSWTRRNTNDRPCHVLDPFGAVPGLPELVWNPIDGCVDPLLAERRAKAFTAGTIKAGSSGTGDAAARFYATQAANVLQCYFHAAALTGQSLDAVLRWVANPLGTQEPVEILREHPNAAPFWNALLTGSLTGDERTAGNTITTVQQALSLFFQPDIRRRCIPAPGRPATDIAATIAAGGTIYLLGREDPYASASPLMTAVAEHVLDTALGLATASPYGRLCPPMLACLDELPSTAPLPTLRTRMANERALGISFIYAAQTWRQLAALFGEQEARALLGLTNVLVLFGGSKDVGFNREIAEMVGTVRVARTTWQLGGKGGRTASGEDMPILKPEEIRQIPTKQALVVPENAPPLIADLTRCIDGKPGGHLLNDQTTLQQQVDRARAHQIAPHARQLAALANARRHALIDQHGQD